MANNFNADDFVEVYATDSAAEADRIAQVVLVAEGVEAVVHNRSIQAFPTPSSAAGQFTIAVPAAQREQAETLIREYVEASKAPA